MSEQAVSWCRAQGSTSRPGNGHRDQVENGKLTMGTENSGEELGQRREQRCRGRKEHGESQAEDYLLHLIEIPMQVPF